MTRRNVYDLLLSVKITDNILDMRWLKIMKHFEMFLLTIIGISYGTLWNYFSVVIFWSGSEGLRLLNSCLHLDFSIICWSSVASELLRSLKVLEVLVKIFAWWSLFRKVKIKLRQIICSRNEVYFLPESLKSLLSLLQTTNQMM